MNSLGYSGSGNLDALAQAQDADELTGEVIGGILEVGDLLGRGGMGVVYQVFHREWNRQLAMKVPINLGVGGNFDLRRWVREAHTWIDLGLHPRVVSCWFVREWKGVPVLFLDLFSGGSLKEKMAARTGPPQTPEEWAEALVWLIHTAEGLGHAHDMGLVHRDIKPANLLFNDEGVLAVTDFGLGKAFGKAAAQDRQSQLANMPPEVYIPAAAVTIEHDGHSLTRTGVMTGTPHYAPPEQWMQQQVGPQADIYALGVVAFQILTYRHPFEPPEERWDLGRLVTAHLMTEPPNPRDINPDIPEQLADVVLKCLAKKPAERPANLEFVRDVLVASYREMAGKDYSFGVPQPLSQRADSLNNKAVSLWSIGLRNEAVQAWAEADRLERNHLEVTYNRMVTSWLMGRRKAAEVEEALVELSTTSTRALSALGLFLLSRGEYKRASELLADGLDSSPLKEDGTVWRALGEAFKNIGALDRAKEAFEKTLELIPADRPAREALDSLAGENPKIEGLISRRSFADRGRLTQVTMLESGKGIAAMFGRTLVLINLTGQEMCSVELPSLPTIQAFESKGRHLLVAGPQEALLLSFVVVNGEWKVETLSQWRHRVIGFVGAETLLTGDTTLQVRNRSDESARGPLLVGHEKRVWCCLPLSDKRRLLTSGADRVIRLWDLKDAQCIHEGRGHRDYVKQMILARREQLLITGDNSGGVLFFLVDTLERLQKLEFNGVIERLVVSGSGQQEVLFVQYKPQSAPARTAVVYLDRFHVVFDQEGSLVSWEPGYGLWDENGFRLHNLPDGVEWRDLSVTDDTIGYCLNVRNTNDLIFWSDKQEFLRWRMPAEVPEAPALPLVRANTLSEVQQARQQFASLMEAAWAAYRSEDWSEAYWQLSRARNVEGYAREPETLAFLTRLSKKLCRRELREMWKVRELTSPGKDITRRLIVDEQGKWAATASGALIRLWDLRNGTCVRGLAGHRDEVVKLAFWEDGPRSGAAPLLFSFSSDRTVRLWESNTGECLGTTVCADQAIVTVGVLASSQFFAIVERSGTVRTGRWQGTKPYEVEMLQSTEGVGFPRGVRVAPNGRWVVVDEDRCLVFRLSELQAEPKKEYELDYHLTKLPTANHLIGSTRQGGLHLYDLNDGLIVVEYPRHGHPITAMSCSSDGGVAAVIDSQNVLQLWLVDAKQCVLDRPLGIPIKEIVFSGNGRYLAGLSAKGSLIVWELEWQLDPDQPHAETLKERIPVRGFWSRLKRRFKR